jgi:hypothetical protein
MKSLLQVFEDMRQKIPKKFIEKIGKIKVFEVDGDWIRNYTDVEFTNFGQHYRFDFIPEKEFWLDREAQPGERQFYIDHLRVEYNLMKNRMTYKKALKLADQKEKNERQKASGQMIHKRIEKADKKYWKSLEGVKIWIVNGKKVRDTLDIDFTEGGHGYVYGFIPHDEVWIDDDVEDDERKYILIHELKERDLMKDQKRDYNKAHKKASEVEHLAREANG